MRRVAYLVVSRVVSMDEKLVCEKVAMMGNWKVVKLGDMMATWMELLMV